MTFVLGIDIGMSYTAGAIGRRGADGSLAFESLELGMRKSAVPTVVYLGQDGIVMVGEPAERRAIEHPEHVVREFKRRIGDETPLIVGDLSVAPEDIFAVVAQWVVERAEEREGCAPEIIAVSHPASWGEHRLALVRDALAGVGLADVELVSEPEAAGLHYLEREKVETGEAIAVYDLGGGTFDVALLEKHEDGTFRVIGTPTGIERLGGADFDQRIFEHVKSVAASAFVDIDDRQPESALALARVRRECTDAKESLSFDAETVLPVMLPTSQTRVRLVRSEFEQMIEDSLHKTVETLRDAVRAADLEPEDLSAVLLIGGSSRIPAVTQLISSELELPVAIDANPKASISLGAAVAASRRLEPIDAPEPDDTVTETRSPERSGRLVSLAPAPAGAAALPERRLSIGLRATVLAGVAAALLALLIPISPLAAGDPEQERGPNETTGEPSKGTTVGRYVTGTAPQAESAAPSETDLDVAPGSGLLDTRPGEPSAIFRPVAGAADSAAGASAPPSSAGSPVAAQNTSTDPSPSENPVAQPEPSPEPQPDPSTEPDPEPSVEPEPEPSVDPTPEPSPQPSPEATTTPEPEPAPTPIADPAETPPPSTP